MTDFYKQLSDDVIHELDSNIDTGLSSDEVTQRQEEHGLNELEESEQRSIGEILLENLNNMIVYLLGFAALLSMFMGDWVEAVAILIAVLIAVLTGFFAEYSAQQSVEALQNVVDTTARVIRDGKEQEIPANEIVPGDILLLNEGDAIAADGRLISANNLAVMEAALTGESEAVDKDAETIIEDDEALGDQINMVFSGTATTRGNMPPILEVGSQFGVAPMATAFSMLIGKNLSLMISPLVPATFLALGLVDGIDYKTHLKFSAKYLWITSLILLAFAFLIGIIQF